MGQEEKPSFWTTVPGIVTAVGAVIGALAALITAFHTAGVFSSAPSEKPAQEARPQNSDPAMPSVTPPDVKPDRTDAQATAIAILNAMKKRDVITLAGLSTDLNRKFYAEIAQHGEAHPRYNTTFSDYGMCRAADAWNGVIGPPIIKGDIADVPFALSVSPEKCCVHMEKENGKWCFDDIHTFHN